MKAIQRKAWVSFYNTETEALLKECEGNPFNVKKAVVAHTFKKVARKTGINITPQT